MCCAIPSANTPPEPWETTTPAAVVRNGTLPDQQTLLATLGTLPERINESEIKPPALIIVGSVVSLHEKLSWFEKS